MGEFNYERSEERIERLAEVVRASITSYPRVRVTVTAEYGSDYDFTNEEHENFTMTLVFPGEGAAERIEDDEDDEF